MTSLDETQPAATRTVLRTGTSFGIGRASAVAAAQAGWTVIAIMRDLNRCGRLDAVVNNAERASIGTVEVMSITDFVSAMEVNSVGVVEVRPRSDAPSAGSWRPGRDHPQRRVWRRGASH
jgi:NAD(P)-dependent dehydrogenase (short-subunit alcohol dehydrogenase family)